MRAKIARWGNSLAVRLPADIVRDLGFREGQIVELTSHKPNLEIAPQPGERRRVNGIPVYTLAELLADMDRLGPEAVPPCVDWGADRGSEIIDDEYSPGEITFDDIPNRDVPGRG